MSILDDEDHPDRKNHPDRRIVDLVFKAITERLDNQDAMILEIRDKITAHMASEDAMAEPLRELAALWKGSKILAAILTGIAAFLASVLALWSWARGPH